MNELKGLVEEILRDGFTISLGTVDDRGVWVADVIYVHDDELNLYWISLPSARHSQAVEKNRQAAGTIVASDETSKERALQLSGIVVRVDGPLFDLEKKLYAKRGKPAPREPGEILQKGHVWYKLAPSFFELIYGEKFGYEKQRYERN